MTRPTAGVVSFPNPHTPLKLLPSAANQYENQPDLPPFVHVARILSEVRNLPLMVIGPTAQSADGPACVHFIWPTIADGPPAAVTFHVPLALIAVGGRYLLPV